jgi:ribosomal-protein-alanine N-acetyltransferase
MSSLNTQKISTPLFETSRTVIYPFTLDGFNDLKALHQHPDVYITTVTGFSSDERVQAELKEYADEYNHLGISQLKVMTKDENPQFVGRVGLQLMAIDPTQLPSYELRFAIMPTHWGKGFATELALATLDFAFNVLNLDRITMGHAESNVKSQTIATKLKFKSIGIYQHPKGSTPRYELLKADYLAHKEMAQ